MTDEKEQAVIDAAIDLHRRLLVVAIVVHGGWNEMVVDGHVPVPNDLLCNLLVAVDELGLR